MADRLQIIKNHLKAESLKQDEEYQNYLRKCSECELDHEKALSQCERESMQFVTVLQILALGSGNAGEFDRRRKQYEDRVLNEHRRSPRSRCPVVVGHIDTLTSRVTFMSIFKTKVFLDQSPNILGVLRCTLSH